MNEIVLYGFWFALGLLAVTPLLVFAQKLKQATAAKLLGRSLIIAAIIYLGFALVWGDAYWFGIEVVGVVIYACFYLVPKNNLLLWVGLGWLFHPVWDVALHMLGPGMHVAPLWYAVACASFDIAVAGYCGYRHLQAEKTA